MLFLDINLMLTTKKPLKSMPKVLLFMNGDINNENLKNNVNIWNANGSRKSR